MNYKEITILFIIVLGSLGCLFFIRMNWKRYGFLFLFSVIVSNLICYILTYIGFYSFPDNVLHGHLLIPYGLVSSVFPFMALAGIRYSPEKWGWKIPYYWVFVHLGVLGEVILKNSTIFKFEQEWDLWDSYTLWWIYFLLFELLGGKVLPKSSRKPIHHELFRYGNWGWIISHIILITTIFLAGVYVGITVL